MKFVQYIQSVGAVFKDYFLLGNSPPDPVQQH